MEMGPLKASATRRANQRGMRWCAVVLERLGCPTGNLTHRYCLQKPRLHLLWYVYNPLPKFASRKCVTSAACTFYALRIINDSDTKKSAKSALGEHSIREFTIKCELPKVLGKFNVAGCTEPVVLLIMANGNVDVTNLPSALCRANACSDG